MSVSFYDISPRYKSISRDLSYKDICSLREVSQFIKENFEKFQRYQGIPRLLVATIFPRDISELTVMR